MPRFIVWVSQLRMRDVVIQAETARDAEAQARTRLTDAPQAQAWLDSATVMRSVMDNAAPGAAPRRDFASFLPATQHSNLGPMPGSTCTCSVRPVRASPP